MLYAGAGSLSTRQSQVHVRFTLPSHWGAVTSLTTGHEVMPRPPRLGMLLAEGSQITQSLLRADMNTGDSPAIWDSPLEPFSSMPS